MPGVFNKIHQATREDAELLRRIALQLGPFVLPVLDAALAGRIEIVRPLRSSRAPMSLLRRADRPVVCWIGDDDDASTGPEGWRSAAQVTRWARAALVHGAGGEPQHYEAAVLGAEQHGRFLLIETSSRKVPGWLRMLSPEKSVLIVVPRFGVEHPVLEMVERRH